MESQVYKENVQALNYDCTLISELIRKWIEVLESNGQLEYRGGFHKGNE